MRMRWRDRVRMADTGNVLAGCTVLHGQSGLIDHFSSNLEHTILNEVHHTLSLHQGVPSTPRGGVPLNTN